MSQDPKTSSWWHTVPGMLTAAAAFITAMTGFLVAINQAGWLAVSPREAVTEVAEPTRDTGSAPVADTRLPEPPDDRATPAALLPSMTQLSIDDATYSLLDLRTEQQSPQTFALIFTVRMTSHRDHSHNFTGEAFRLLVDDVPRAPVNFLSKLVRGHSAEEGEVRFSVPHSAESLVLQIRGGEDVMLIPLERRGR